MKYRGEIDGLRAIAVVPVILFHAGFESFKGGFVGVDVFFVISGYLITTIILSEKEKGTFSLVNFYERRIRRILPALFFVMAISLAAAWYWLLPSEMQHFSQSLVAVSTFSSNVFFWRTSGYWGIENELIPLLHTWSLAVEEQYYAIFPLFLMLMWRFRRRWILGSFVILAATSLLVAQWGAFQHPTATFFLLLTRGWELAIGAVIAFYFVYRKNDPPALISRGWIPDSLGLLGILLIAYAVLSFDETVPFPSFYALVPTIGTGLIILFSSSRTAVGRLLGLKPLVGIGLISYSAYLWHLPLFAFARYRSLTDPGTMLLVALALASFLLAFFSWSYVEKPFRQKENFSRKTIFMFAIIGSAVFTRIGLLGHDSGGWPERVDSELRVAVESAQVRIRSEDLCLENGDRVHPDTGACKLVEGDGQFALLIGDSHADAVSSGMKSVFEASGLGLIQATEMGCPPVQNVYVYVSESDKQRCFGHNDAVYQELQNNADIEYVIMVARWGFYLEGSRFDNEEGGVEHAEKLYFAGDERNERGHPESTDHADHFANAYAESVARILDMGKKVILVYPVPEAGWHVPRYVRNSYFADPDRAFSLQTGSTSHEVFKNRNRSAYAALDSIGESPALSRVYPERMFCDNDLKGRCIVQMSKQLLYRDDDHLSAAGSDLVARAILNRLH